MKKIIISFILVTILLLSLVGCATSTIETEGQQMEESTISMFVEVESTTLWKIVYHKETKVMYAISNGGYNHGTFTLLVDSEGNPMTWDK